MDQSRRRLRTAVRQAGRRNEGVQRARGIQSARGNASENTNGDQASSSNVRHLLETRVVRKALEDVARKLLRTQQKQTNSGVGQPKRRNRRGGGRAAVDPETTFGRRRRRFGAVNHAQQQQQQQQYVKQTEQRLFESFGRRIAQVVQQEMKKTSGSNSIQSRLQGTFQQLGGLRGRSLRTRPQNRGRGNGTAIGNARGVTGNRPVQQTRGGRGRGRTRGGNSVLPSTDELDRQLIDYRN